MILLQFLPHYPSIAERIRRCLSPSDAVAEARRFNAYVRSEWKRINIQIVRCRWLDSFPASQRVLDGQSIVAQIYTTSGLER